MNDEVCQVKMSRGKTCGRQTYKDKKRCIFHLENKSDEEAKIFDEEFRKELERMKKDENIKKLDFTGFIFTNEAVFVNAQFNSETYFIQAQFNKADFFGAQFKDVAHFQYAQFKGVADFNQAQFNKDVSFVNTQFNNKADFLGTQFNNKAYFINVEFNNSATFEFSEFQNAVFFNNAKFPSNDEDLISFKNAKFHKPKDVRFQNINLRNVSFVNTDVSEVEFLDVKWRKIPLLKKLKLVGSRLVVVDEALIEKNYTTYDSVAQLYRRLRRNYETNYRFAEAGEFFIGEMEMRRHKVSTRFKRFKNEEVIVLWFRRNFSLLGLYKYLSLYGESYILPLIWASIVIVSYPMLMHWLFNTALPQPDNSPYTYLRTSYTSFFQMDNTYRGERIIGALLLGLLFIALKRQFERKK